MFLVRAAAADDHAAILRLRRMLDPATTDESADDVTRLITASRDAFAERADPRRARRYLFVLEDTDTASVVGLSSVRSADRDAPGMVALRMTRREHYSQDLQSGQVHVTLALEHDPRPFTRLEGVVLAPPYRSHRGRVGALLGLVRLHFIGLHRAWFDDAVVAALPAPTSRDGLWEHLGRRFINLRRAEAARFREQSDEFILSLFPDAEIYVSLLPPSARTVIGRVDEAARPAQRGLERAGIGASGRVDPLDGGPIHEAATDAVPMVTGSRTATLGDPVEQHPTLGLVSVERNGLFRAIRSRYAESPTGVSIPGEAAGLLNIHVGDTIGFTPLAE